MRLSPKSDNIMYIRERCCVSSMCDSLLFARYDQRGKEIPSWYCPEHCDAC